jgi:ketosteroid isomerase-like protein
MLLWICLASMLALAQATGAPQAAMNRLLDADRSFSAAAAGKAPVDALAAMFADDVTVPAGATFVQGQANAIAAMRGNPDNLVGGVEWVPIGGGISADGTHGFTFGYMTASKTDESKVPLKYLAYWVRGADGWRVAVYRRRPRAEGNVSLTMMKAALPARMMSASDDAGKTTNFGDSLVAAEKAFSDLAQKVGLQAAFAQNGRADAINMGGPKAAAFIVGAQAISQSVGEGAPADRSELEWSADRVLVASSGDLGVTIGMIRVHTPEAGQPASFPFFTIWRRDDPSQPWRYIAE